jgi:Bacterial PH domain
MTGVTALPYSGTAPVRLYSLHNRIFNVIGLAGGAVIAFLVAGLNGLWPVQVLAALVTVGLGAWAVRGARVGVECGPQELVIRELSRTHRIRWADVESVRTRSVARFKITAPELVISTEKGNGTARISAMSLAHKNPAVVKRHVDTLGDLLQAHGGTLSG